MRIVITHMGGLGDLVLFRECYDSLRAAYRDAEITVVCRAANAGLFSFCEAQPDRVIPMEFNPYAWTVPGNDLRAQLELELAKLPAQTPDLFLSPELNPTWLSWVIAARLRPKRSIIASAQHTTPFLAREVLLELELPHADTEYFTPKGAQAELMRYRSLLEMLKIARAQPPEWRIPEEASSTADSLLRSYALEPKRYLACFPLTATSTRVKRWPADRYAEVLTNLQKTSQLGVLLLGDLQEADDLATLEAKLKEKGVPAATFAGSPGDVQVVAALLTKSRAYIGNDTGLAHLAAALGTPGLTLHGGGVWPMYAPWRDGMVGIVNPLPCFGCFWDCTFDRGICVESIPVEAVGDALERMLAQSGPHPPQIIEVSAVPASEQRIIADATSVYRKAQEERQAALERVAVIGDLKQALDDRDRHAKQLQEAVMQQTKEIEQQQDEVHRIRQGGQEREKVIQELKAALNDRDGHAKQLQDAAEQREKQLRELGAALAERDGRLSALTAQLDELRAPREAAEEREKVITELRAALEETDRRAKSLQEAADLRGQKIEELEAATHGLRGIQKIAEEREKVITELRAALEETDRRAKSLQEAADLRGQKIEELAAALETRDARLQELETKAKGFDELLKIAEEREQAIFDLTAALAEREALLQELNDALKDRERRIAQLERVAEERLAALKETDEGLRAVTAEADRRAIMLAEVTSLLQERTEER